MLTLRIEGAITIYKTRILQQNDGYGMEGYSEK